ncbi:hypothetical protein ACVWYG_002564 [Pedobacter sp. UYEF25]
MNKKLFACITIIVIIAVIGLLALGCGCIYVIYNIIN